MMRLILQFLLFLTICAPVYAGKVSASAQDQQSFVSQYWQAQQAGPDAVKQFQNQVNQAANDPNATDAQIAQAQMLNNLNSGKTVNGDPGVPNATPQAQQDFNHDYWQAKDNGPDALKQFQQDVQDETTNNPNPTPEQMAKLQMLNNMNAGKGPDGGPPVGFHGDPNDPGPSNWSNYDIKTDANGNVIGFDLKNKDQIDTNGDGQISPEEWAAWKAKQDAENKKNGGPPGFRPPPPPPGVGPDGKLVTGFSLMCWRCYKTPFTSVNRTDIRCHGSEEGACTDNACPADQECEQYSEKSDITAEVYYCHNCNDKPKVPDNCENHGYSSDGNCGGKCDASGGQCVPVDIDPSTNNIVPSTATRDSNSNMMSCFACKGGTSIISQLMCSKDGYSVSSTCDGKCPTGDCEAVALSNQTGEEMSGKTFDANTVHTCYRCNSHSMWMNAICSKDGYSGTSTCDGKCPASDCEAVALSNQTGQEVSGTTFDANTIHTCYRCNMHSTWMNAYCSKDGYYGTSTCNNQCSASDCTAAAINDKTGQVVQGTTFDANTVHTCWFCKDHSTVSLTSCSKDGLWDSPSCNNQCPTGMDCETVDNNGKTCYACKSHATVATQDFCAKDSMWNNASCDSQCPAGSDCIAMAINQNTHSILHPGETTTDPVQTCYVCQSHKVVVNQDFCSKDSMWSNPNCSDQCPSGTECEGMTINQNTHSILEPGQTTTDPVQTCYVCKSHHTAALVCPTGSVAGTCPSACSSDQDCVSVSSNCAQCNARPKTATGGLLLPPPTYTTPVTPGGFVAKNNCDVGDEGGCSPNPCAYDQECKMITKKSNGAAYDCHMCKSSPMSEEKDACEEDHYYDDYCEDDCPPDACEPINIDRSTGKIAESSVPSSSTYECYECVPFEDYIQRIKEEYQNSLYVLIVDENTYVRYVLNNSSSGSSTFQPASVMALAKVDPSTGKIPNVSGNLQAITSMMGGFNVGFGPGGITTTGTVSLDQLSSALGSSLGSGGDYGSNCFDNVKDAADKQAASAGTPTSQDISEGKQNDQDSGSSEKAYSPGQIQQSSDAGAPAVSGPVLACGTQNGQKVLQVLDSSGKLVSMITQDMYKANPQIIMQQLGIAQNFTDGIVSGNTVNLNVLAEKLNGLFKPATPTSQGQVPNDPLYPKQKAEKKKEGGLFSVLFGSGDSTNIPINADGVMKVQTYDMVENGDGVTDQYYLPIIGYTPLNDPNSAWNAVDATQKNVIVALVDSGLDISHPDGPKYLWTNPKDGSHGWNFVNDNTDLTDFRGHGTFVAGIIAAKWNNGIGIAGINPGAVILPVKVTDDKGKTNSLAIYRGINYAVDHGAKIINVSLGGVTISKLEQAAIARANAMGALVVIAAGNTSNNLMEFGPSSSPYALAVGMTDMGGKERSLVSSWGPNLGLVAPGEKIISLASKDAKDVLPSIRKYGYMKQSGTSFTAPMVTATASLILARNPQLTNQQIADIIRSTATPMGEGNWNDQTGFGLLNAAAALQAAPGQGVVGMITNIHVNYDTRDRISSVDVYGTVRGDFKQFTLEAARGGGGFRQVAGPFQTSYDYRLIGRLDIRRVLYGSKEWRFRIRIIGNDGKEYTAVASFSFPDK